MEKTSSEYTVDGFKQFLNEICESWKDNTEEDDRVAVRLPNPRVTPEELEGECLDWCLQYLSTRKCPPVLAAHLSHETYTQVAASDLESYLEDTQPLYDDDEPTENTLVEYCSEKLHQFTISKLESVCCQWQQNLPDLQLAGSFLDSSFHAIKNVRRKMEDSHVILPDLNALFGLKDEPAQSFYAVYDGHAGSEASLFTSKHLHCQLVHKCPLSKNPEDSSKSAFMATDQLFIPKAKRERWRSGCTGVTALVRDKKLYLSWLGDSQAVLVRDGKAVSHMEPHKPDRKEERDRIAGQGGFVMKVGDMYRVGGNLAVSRAIGDVAYKPFVSSEAEVQVFDLDGSEEYLVLACDGLWDVLPEEELSRLVYNYLAVEEGNRSSLAQHLVQYAKDNDSMDNISVIVVFFRDSLSEPFNDMGLFNFLSNDTQGSSNNKTDGSDAERGDSGEGGNSKQYRDNSGGGDSGKNNNSGQINGEENKGGNSEESVRRVRNVGAGIQEKNQDREELDEINTGDIKHNTQDGLKLAQKAELSSYQARISRELDLDYYGVFNTRLSHERVDLSAFDDNNSSTLLRDIADSVLNRTKQEFDDLYEAGIDVHWKENVSHHNLDHLYGNITVRQGETGKKIGQTHKKSNRKEQKVYNTRGLATSPICWAFTGKNVPSVQNHRLNMAAKSSTKSSNPTLGELTLAAKAPHPLTKLQPLGNPMENKHLSDFSSIAHSLTKLEALQPLRPKVLANTHPTNNSSSNITVFGSKSFHQTEMQKFHTTWRPRKPLKPISTVVYESPPTPFVSNKLGGSRQH